MELQTKGIGIDGNVDEDQTGKLSETMHNYFIF